VAAALITIGVVVVARFAAAAVGPPSVTTHVDLERQQLGSEGGAGEAGPLSRGSGVGKMAREA
jgi:hypothetical protein